MVPVLAGAFVTLGEAGEGFLPLARQDSGLSEGARVLVRVVRAAQGGKGVRLTRHPATGFDLETAPRRLQTGPGPLSELAERFPALPILLDDAAIRAELPATLTARTVLCGTAFDDALESEITALAEPVAMLGGGMCAHFAQTRALTAIDIDLGSGAAGPGGKTHTHLAANRTMLPELVRQIVLRNLGGPILIDFAGLAVKARAALAGDLVASLQSDPLKTRFLGISGLGFAEIVRPRLRPPLAELLAGPHAAGLAALRLAARELRANPAARLCLRAAPIVVAALRADQLAWPALCRLAAHTPQLIEDRDLPADRVRLDILP
jgi:hypothetical protein